eukprot:765047-Hanusia_phi.AAC.1
MLDAFGQLLLVRDFPVLEASQVLVELPEEALPGAPVMQRERLSSRALNPRADLPESADELSCRLLHLPLK